jgi:hypothetical protein
VIFRNEDKRSDLPKAYAVKKLLADNLYQHPLAAAAVKLAVKNLFPGAEIKPAARGP